METKNSTIGHDELMGIVQALAESENTIEYFNMEVESVETSGPDPEFRYYKPGDIITMTVKYKIHKDGKS
jgi:hypothetical protein